MKVAAIGLGSNLGDRQATLYGAIDALAEQPQIEVSKVSSFYRSSAIGPLQPDYLNACVTINTSLDAEHLLEILWRIEDQWGRTRTVHWGARTLDLDLLLYADQRINLPQLIVPHPHLLNRNFVLIPLAEIAPDWLYPLTQKSIQALADDLDYSGLEIVATATAKEPKS